MKRKEKQSVERIDDAFRHEYGRSYQRTFSEDFRKAVKEVDKMRAIVAKKGIRFSYGSEEDE